MKDLRNIAAILVLAALVAGCAKAEFGPDQEKEITFTVGRYVPATTKAVSLIDSQDNITSFSTKAYLYAEGIAETQNFFGTAGETITWNPTASEWAPTHPYYWPKSSNSYINFVSWYDNAGAPTTVSETALEWVGRTISGSDNILFADVAWRYNNNATTYRFNNVVGGVPTLFHHALARVQVNLKETVAVNPDIPTETYEVTLQSASLEGMYNAGTMKLLNNDPGSTGTSAWRSNGAPTILWTSQTGSNATPFVSVDSNTAIGTTPTAIVAQRSFMPQNLGDNVVLKLTYTVTTKSNGVVTIEERDIPATIRLNTIKNSSNMEITQWLPNRIYKYNIAINPIGQTILLNPVVESDWGFSTGLSTTVE